MNRYFGAGANRRILLRRHGGGVGAGHQRTARLSRESGGRTPVRPIRSRWPGVAGFVGAVCVLIGVAQAGSPFVLKAPGAWYFGVGTSPGSKNGTFLGIMLVYAGVAVLVGSWFEIVRTLRRHPGAPLGLRGRHRVSPGHSPSWSCPRCSAGMSTATWRRAK